ncbi:protein of unknown function [Flavobacteriaceae bacterium MAR_2010_188]|nr:protein of unknown function [Flavobacteriaceae bacterium MAR_2010_188]
MKLTALRNASIIALLITCFISCDEDFTTIDSDIIDENGSQFNQGNEKYEVLTYNTVLAPVQTDGLPTNLLGVFNDKIYGTTTASIVTQVVPSSYNPNFGENTVLDSVILTIPYFSKVKEVVDQTTTYKLDSVFGSDPINITLFENKYFLRNFDPTGENINQPQKYYSNGSNGSTTIPQSLLEGPVISRIDSFVPSAEQVLLKDAVDVVTRYTPGLRVKLDPEYWINKIIEKEGSTELSNGNNFSDYFRGIYFKAEAIDGKGNLSLLNIASTNATITLFYTRDASVATEDPVQSTFSFSFGGNRVNLISPLDFTLPESDSVNGDSRLYLKGLQGTTSVVELFNGTDIDADNDAVNAFEDFKNDFVFTDENGKFLKSKRLVNEANLVFYVNQDAVDGNEPERIYLYDMNNNIHLVDYENGFDPTNTAFPYLSKSYHLGRLQRVGDAEDGKGIKYKIRITDHINNILIKDSTNVKLGLSISGNVNLEASGQFDVLSEDNSQRVPVSSIISPRSTVLYGSNVPGSEESKRVRLEIYYTEPDLNN